MYDPDDELFEEGWMNGHDVYRDHEDGGIWYDGIAPMPRTMKRPRWSIGIHTNMNFRGDTVATRRGREFEREEGRMAPTGKRRLPAIK